MTHIPEHARRYWQYQYDVAKQHMIPLLQGWGVRLSGATMMDVGSGTGGGTCAMHDAGVACTGYDVNPRLIAEALDLKGDRQISFSTDDVYIEDPLKKGVSFDLVVLHDVFEHLDHKDAMMQKLKLYMKPGARMLITFPPYFSAYGAHQQHLRAWYAKLPFVHLVPLMMARVIPGLHGEDAYAMEEVTKLGRLKMGMGGFEEIASRNDMRIVGKKAYLISPNHMRFGLPSLAAGPIASIPGLGELLCTGAVYLLAKS